MHSFNSVYFSAQGEILWSGTVACHFSQKETGSLYFSFPDLWRAVKNMAGDLQFSVWAEKNEPDRIYPKKYTQLTRCKIFCHHRRCRSNMKSKKTRNNKIWSQHSIDRKMCYSLNKGLNRTRLSIVCFLHGFKDLICYLSNLFLPNGCRKFHENKANRVEKHKHFWLQKLLAII